MKFFKIAITFHTWSMIYLMNHAIYFLRMNMELLRTRLLSLTPSWAISLCSTESAWATRVPSSSHTSLKALREFMVLPTWNCLMKLGQGLTCHRNCFFMVQSGHNGFLNILNLSKSSVFPCRFSCFLIVLLARNYTLIRQTICPKI